MIKLTIICPVYNEEAFLPALLDFLISVEPKDKEILLVDGGSEDRSLQIIEKYVQEHSQIRLLHNPNKIVPYALNLAIEESTAPIISRIDAHSVYEEDYFEKILETFANVEADVVGGPTRTTFDNSFQEAVGYAISSRLGVGGSKVHQPDYKGYTDSVTFGAWKKQIFNTVGLFDERFKRNQDDEFHYRLGAAGFKVYQNPEIKIYYYPRSTLTALFKQYYQYGLYKPLVLTKITSGFQLRHIIPSLFVGYIALFGTVSWMHPILFAPMLMYMALSMLYAISAKVSFGARIRLPFVYFTLHFSYGLGFIFGLLRLKKLKRPKTLSEK